MPREARIDASGGLHHIIDLNPLRANVVKDLKDLPGVSCRELIQYRSSSVLKSTVTG